MILTGEKIRKEFEGKTIFIEPFSLKQVKRDSYNYRLGRYLKEAYYDDNENLRFVVIDLKKCNSYTIKKNTLYLGTTYERIGSNLYTMSLIGKSSLGRLGLFLQISANLGHTGSNHNWTLEIYSPNNIIIYYKMVIGQVSFWVNDGILEKTEHYYNKFSDPRESTLMRNKGEYNDTDR